MTNFIFKSPSSDLQKIRQQLLTVLAEQRHQRADLSEIKFMLHKLLTNKDLQNQVDEYFEGPPEDRYKNASSIDSD